MKLLLDQGLPRSAAEILRRRGLQARHTAECGLSTADDEAIIAFARSTGELVITLDSDFHTLLAVQDADSPSVVRIRIEALKGPAMATLIMKVLEICREALQAGAAVSVREDHVRIHHLPLRVSKHQTISDE